MSVSTSESSILPTGMVTLIWLVVFRPLWEVAVMVTVPSLTPVTVPSAATVAMLSSLLSQVKSVGPW